MGTKDRLVSVNGKAVWYVEELGSFRESLLLTQQKLAELTRKLDPQGRGVSKETISRMERMHGVSKITAGIVVDTIKSLLKSSEVNMPSMTRAPKRGASGLMSVDD